MCTDLFDIPLRWSLYYSSLFGLKISHVLIYEWMSLWRFQRIHASVIQLYSIVNIIMCTKWWLHRGENDSAANIVDTFYILHKTFLFSSCKTIESCQEIQYHPNDVVLWGKKSENMGSVTEKKCERHSIIFLHNLKHS